MLNKSRIGVRFSIARVGNWGSFELDFAGENMAWGGWQDLDGFGTLGSVQIFQSVTKQMPNHVCVDSATEK